MKRFSYLIIAAVFALAAAGFARAEDTLEIQRGNQITRYDGHTLTIVQRGAVGSIEFGAEDRSTRTAHIAASASPIPTGDWDVSVMGAGGDGAEHCGLVQHVFHRYPGENQYLLLRCAQP